MSEELKQAKLDLIEIERKITYGNKMLICTENECVKLYKISIGCIKTKIK